MRSEAQDMQACLQHSPLPDKRLNLPETFCVALQAAAQQALEELGVVRSEAQDMRRSSDRRPGSPEMERGAQASIR